MKNVITKVLEVCLLSICGFLIISNIHHLAYINYISVSVMDDNSNKQLNNAKENIIKVEKNFNKIAMLNRNVINDADMITLTTNLSEILTTLKESNLHKLTLKSKMKLTTLAENNKIYEPMNYYYDSYKVLEKYDKNITNFLELTIDTAVGELYASYSEYRKPTDIYNYTILDTADFYKTNIDQLLIRIMVYKEETSKALYLSREILRIEGETYE